MITVVNEDELKTIQLRKYDDVLAVRPGEREYGVEIWRARRIATIYDKDTEAKVSILEQLLVEVEDPDDEAVINRLKDYCQKAWFS
ncbi:hypothetical protein [Pseudomonas sp. NFPP24]|uniref:hypothetical protein n=1 Tax=Pseudomonas sp. NFPP24 TaxID=1566228 RepID=UPI0008E53353|nr:hypothetical protein [Pseudomonas sp. NFPP24]SFB40400.1 hypothetical protein SAMN03159485_05205 [Pseudomonas sp. NFPP24]